MKLLKNWLKKFKESKWAKSPRAYFDEEFEITDFDHTPFIDENLKVGH